MKLIGVDLNKDNESDEELSDQEILYSSSPKVIEGTETLLGKIEFTIDGKDYKIEPNIFLQRISYYSEIPKLLKSGNYRFCIYR